MMGESAVSVLDTSSFLSFGSSVLDSRDNVEKFYDTLVDRIGRTIIAVREWQGVDDDPIKRNEMEFGVILQKITFDTPDVIENPVWTPDTPYNPYEKKKPLTVHQNFFKSLEGYALDTVIYDYQVKTAFINEVNMGAFVNAIYLTMMNKWKLLEKGNITMANAIGIGHTLKYGNPAQKRFLLDEYNTLKGTNLTVSQCLTDVGFMKYVSMEVSNIIDYMSEPTKVFNTKRYERNTEKQYMVFKMLSSFYNFFVSYAEADTFHNELIKLPYFKKIRFWQGSGTNFSFSDVSSINVTLPAEDTNESSEISFSNIIGVIHDYDYLASTLKNEDVVSDYDKFNKRTLMLMTGDRGFMCDSGENCVVLALTNAVASASIKALKTRKAVNK